MRIAFGNDHAAAETRQKLVEWIGGRGHDVIDFGTKNVESVDYPDFASQVARAVASGQADLGVLVCGSGVGMSIAANKVRGVRAALCVDEYSAEMGRRHNDANVCCLRSREQETKKNLHILEKFLDTQFEAGRHSQRVEKIRELEGC
jgi:ribose 5-phosphate isomerase B